MSSAVTMILIQFVTILMLLNIVGVGVSAQHLIGDHVCKHEEKYKVTVEKHSKKNITIREFVWCMSVPPRCSKYKTIQRDEIKVEEEDRVKEIYKCCEGYQEDNARTYCIPSCKECINGICQNPNTCVCTAGFTGKFCDEACSARHWGPNCSSECDCKNGNFCDSKTGHCNCDKIWTGLKCDIPIKTDNNSLIEEALIKNLDEPNENTNKSNITEEKNVSYNYPEHNTISYIMVSRPKMELIKKPENSNTKNVAEQQRVSTPSAIDLEETPKKNFDGTGEIHLFSVKEEWQMNGIHKENKIPYSDSNYYYLIICLGIGLLIVLIIISVMSIIIARYKKQRNLAIKHSSIQINPSSHTNMKRLSTQPILERSIFHAPLPDPPIFKNPVFIKKEDEYFCHISADTVKCNNHEGYIVESTYDYPPSSGSYRKTSINLDASCEPVYDEIPSWRRPRPITCPNSSFITETNPYRHSCCEAKSACEWGAVNS